MPIKNYLKESVCIAPLETFRVLFGLTMVYSLVRFWSKGWITQFYVDPSFHFTYAGFAWIQPLGNVGMHMLFAFAIISAFFLALGFFYRVAAIAFFSSFTYIELIDKTYYLNHYYFISIVALLMIFFPAHRYRSLDAWLGRVRCSKTIPRWMLNSIKLQLGMVYFFAGVAKLNAEWLLHAQPLSIWLPMRSHFPIMGGLFTYSLTAYFFAWFGMAYDLLIPFFLISHKTRFYAYMAVLLFHLMTALLFPIGMFPYIMIFSTLIFFSPELHEKIIRKFQNAFYSLLGLKANLSSTLNSVKKPCLKFSNQMLMGFLIFHFTIQVLLPFRYVLYPGKLFWHEKGYRFSWRVMLMEKIGTSDFLIMDKLSGKTAWATPEKDLTKAQIKMMNTQPDMILQYAHWLGKKYKCQGFTMPVVKVDNFVALNGHRSRRMINPEIDLLTVTDGAALQDWILPFNQGKN